MAAFQGRESNFGFGLYIIIQTGSLLSIHDEQIVPSYYHLKQVNLWDIVSFWHVGLQYGWPTVPGTMNERTSTCILRAAAGKKRKCISEASISNNTGKYINLLIIGSSSKKRARSSRRLHFRPANSWIEHATYSILHEEREWRGGFSFLNRSEPINSRYVYFQRLKGVSVGVKKWNCRKIQFRAKIWTRGALLRFMV